MKLLEALARRLHLVEDFFLYSTQVTVPANQTASNSNVQIGGNAVEIYGLMGSATAPTALTVQVQENGSGVNWFDKALKFSNIVGTPLEPFLFPVSKYANSNAILNIILTDTSGQNNIVELIFISAKVLGAYDKLTKIMSNVE